MYVIVGLGNPGKKYENTKHNAGFWVIDALAEKMGISLDKKNCSSILGTGVFQGKKILLAKPQTYMNLSGEAVIQILNYYDSLEELLIIHDDLDLAEGTFRFKEGGGLAGHNGLKSIAQHLHSQDFDRLRIGLGRPEQQKVVNYVLEPFSSDKKELLDKGVKEAATAAAETWLSQGIQQAMNQHNQKKNKENDNKADDKKDENNKGDNDAK